MIKELKTLIKELANIQIEAYTKLKASPKSVDQYQLNKLIEFNNQNIIQVLESRIRFWEFVKEYPEALEGVSEYQLGVCTHILFVMEETWVQSNPDGVIAMWDLFDKMYKKFHPEIKILWLPKRKSSNT